jgi:hypothetical protein
MTHTCADPSCTVTVRAGTPTGCCRTHAHGDHCRCTRCAPKRRVQPRTPPPDTRVALVTVAHATCNIPSHARVSLPREPWA